MLKGDIHTQQLSPGSLCRRKSKIQRQIKMKIQCETSEVQPEYLNLRYCHILATQKAEIPVGFQPPTLWGSYSV